jgi:hypothetical protein
MLALRSCTTSASSRDFSVLRPDLSVPAPSCRCTGCAWPQPMQVRFTSRACLPRQAGGPVRAQRLGVPPRGCFRLAAPEGLPWYGPGTRRAPMLHLFHLGPVAVGERRSWLLAGVTGQGGFTHPLVGSDLPSGLAAFSARYGPASLRVEPELEAVAAPFGLRAEPLPDNARVPRAVIAFAFLTSRRLFRKPSCVAAFLEACVEFEKARPWTRCRFDEPFGILMAERWRCREREFVIHGHGGQPRGLELHERPGFVARVRAGAGPKVDSLLVTFGVCPAWAVEAVRSAYGLAELPTVIRMTPGSQRPPEPRALLQLAASLRSAALLGGEDASPEYGATVSLSADGFELEAVAAPVLRAPVSALRPSAETPRNAPCPCGSGRKFKRCHLTGERSVAELSTSVEAVSHLLDAMKLSVRDTGELLGLSHQRIHQLSRRRPPDSVDARSS